MSGKIAKLWRQTENSSLLPAKCWPLLHVIRARSWRWPDAVAGISARFSKFSFALCFYITNHLMTGPLGNSELRFSGSKMHCPHRDQSLRMLFHDGSPNFSSLWGYICRHPIHYSASTIPICQKRIDGSILCFNDFLPVLLMVEVLGHVMAVTWLLNTPIVHTQCAPVIILLTLLSSWGQENSR